MRRRGEAARGRAPWGAAVAWAAAALAVGCASDPIARPRSRPPGSPPLLSGTEPRAGEPVADLAPAPAVEGQKDPVLVHVGGRAVRASDLLEAWLQRDSPALKRTLNLLIGARLAQLEADRLGLRVPTELVAERTADHLDGFRETYLRPGEEFNRFVRVRLDLDPDRFVERLRQDTLRELVTERVVRAWSLANEHARVRLIVVEDEAAAAAIQDQLDAGGDFAALARERSLDATAERGGLVAYLARSERAPLSRLAFRTPIGTVGGPLELDGAQVLVLVEGRPAPQRGDWSQVGATVAATLAEEPVSEEEFLVWQLAMEARYGVDLAPFHELVGEPLP